MTDKIDVTIRGDRVKSDFAKLKRIMVEMDNYKVFTADENEAVREWKEEFQRRLIEAGLSK